MFNLYMIKISTNALEKIGGAKTKEECLEFLQDTLDGLTIFSPYYGIDKNQPVESYVKEEKQND